MRRDAGFTLIEMLAVLVLLSLTAGASVFALADTTERARLDDVRSEVLAMDARARLLARGARGGGGAVRIVREPASGSGSLRVARASTGEVLHVVDLHPPIEARLRIDGQVIRELLVDTRGETPDYEIVLSTPSEARVFRVSGVTGLAREEGGR